MSLKPVVAHFLYDLNFTVMRVHKYSKVEILGLGLFLAYSFNSINKQSYWSVSNCDMIHALLNEIGSNDTKPHIICAHYYFLIFDRQK